MDFIPVLLNEMPRYGNVCSNLEDEYDTDSEYPSKNDNKFSRFYEDIDVELYPRYKPFTNLSFIFHLFCLKYLYASPIGIFDMLELLVEIFSKKNSLSKNI